jgi:acyl dehydratase
VRAGVATATALALLGLIANVAFGGDGLSAGVWVASAVVVGLLMASGWLVLALLLDLIAGHVPGQRRVIWTAVLFAVAFVSPVLPAAMLQVAARQ